MKSFSKFLTEAASNASKQAKKLGLVGDGHGSWVDSNGRIGGRTVEGELVFNSGRKPADETDPTRPGSAARQMVPEIPPPIIKTSAGDTFSTPPNNMPLPPIGFSRYFAPS